MITLELDPNIKVRKLDDLYDSPVIIRVEHFNPDAVKSFAADLQRAELNKQAVIPIQIDSYGGQVYSLLAMIDLIKRASKPVATIALGKAMSCGAVLFTFGTEGLRFMAPNATLMIHDVSSFCFGKVEEIKADAKEADRLNKLIFGMMARNCGQSDSYFLDCVHEKGHADWYINAEEAKQHNLANHVRVPEFKVKISLDVQFK